MKELLIQTAKETGLVDGEKLAEYLEENRGPDRVDELLLRCPFFTANDFPVFLGMTSSLTVVTMGSSSKNRSIAKNLNFHCFAFTGFGAGTENDKTIYFGSHI